MLLFCGLIPFKAAGFFTVFKRVFLSAVLWEFFSLYLFILEGSDSLVSVCGRELRDVAAMI